MTVPQPLGDRGPAADSGRTQELHKLYLTGVL
jgi:hypothetical protein